MLMLLLASDDCQSTNEETIGAFGVDQEFSRVILLLAVIVLFIVLQLRILENIKRHCVTA